MFIVYVAIYTLIEVIKALVKELHHVPSGHNQIMHPSLVCKNRVKIGSNVKFTKITDPHVTSFSCPTKEVVLSHTLTYTVAKHLQWYYSKSLHSSDVWPSLISTGLFFSFVYLFCISRKQFT